jgi:tetratricopeptide (TPR) repeat protein
MAKRRLNKKFLIILVATVGVVGLGGVAIVKYRMSETPEQLTAMGELALKERKFVDGFKYLAKASQLSPTDAKLAVRAGMAARTAAAFDTQLSGQDVAYWQKALEIDPNDLDALKALMQHFDELSKLTNEKTLALQMLKEYAKRVVQLDATNKRAAAYVPLTTIQLWQSGAQVPDADLAEAIEQATALWKEDPSNSELPFFLALTYLGQGEKAALRGDAQLVRDSATKAAELAASARAGAPDNAIMQMRMGQIYRSLVRYDAIYRLGSRTEYQELEQQSLEQALSLVKADEPAYLEAAMEMAATYQRLNRRDMAEKVYRQAVERFPNEPQPRLALATLLSQDRATRNEAIEILAKPMDKGSVTLVGVRARQRDSLQMAIDLELTNIRMVAYTDEETSAAEKAALHTAVTAGLQNLSSRMGDSYQVLRLRGKWAYVQGNYVESIKLMGSAKTLGDGMRPQPQDLMEIYFLLARAYMQTGNTGPARELLQSVLARPGMTEGLPVRFLLAQVYKTEGNIEGVAREIAEMKRIAPGNPDVNRMELALMDRTNNLEAAREAYARLPEGTVPERLSKARNAAAINEWDEAIRVLTDGLRETPGESKLTQLLAQVYLAQNKPEEAKRVVNEAVAIHGTDEELQLFKRVLEAGSPEAIAEIQRSVVDETPDETLRALRRARMAQVSGAKAGISDEDRKSFEAEELKQLKLALELAPKSEPATERTRKAGDAAEQIFNYHLRRQQWPEAQEMLTVLTNMNRDQARGLLLKYRMEATKGDWDAALATAQALTREMDQFAQSWFTLGSAYYARGEYAQAIVHYTTALEKKKDYPDAYRGIIDSYYKMNRPEDAKRLIDDAVRVFPQDPMFREVALVHEMQYGDPEKVLAARAEAAKARPDDANAQLAHAQALMRVGQLRFAKGDTVGGNAMAEQAFDIASMMVGKLPASLEVHQVALQAAMGTQRPQRLEPMLKAFAEREEMKGRTEPQVLLADYYARMGELGSAEAALKKVMEFQNNSIDSRLLMANFYQQSRRFDDGLMVLAEAEAALAAGPKNDDTTRQRQVVQRQMVEMKIRAERLDEAETAIRKMMADAPDDPTLSNLLTFTLLNQRKYDEVLVQSGRTLAMRPDDLQAVLYRGLARLRMPRGEVRAAVEDLEKVRTAAPGNLENRLALAEAYRRLDEGTASVAELQAAMRLSPQNKQIRLQLVDWLSKSVPPRWQEVERLLSESRALPAFASDPDFHLAEAVMWLARGDAVRAIAASQMAMKDSGGNPVYAQQYLNVLLNTRRFSQVLSETDQLLAGGASASWVFDARGAAKFGLEDRAGALAEFDRALELANTAKDDGAVDATVRAMARTVGVKEAITRIADRAKTDYRWRMVLATFYLADNDFSNAVATIDAVMPEAEKMTATEKETLYRLAGSIYLTHKPEPLADKAADAFRRLLQLTPNDIGSLNNMAVILVDMVKPPLPAEALVYSQRAIDLMQASGLRNHLLMDTHGWVLAANQRYSEAINQMEAAVAIESFAEGHVHLGVAYTRINSLVEARNQLELAKQRLATTPDAMVAGKLERALAELTKAEEKAKADGVRPG